VYIDDGTSVVGLESVCKLARFIDGDCFRFDWVSFRFFQADGKRIFAKLAPPIEENTVGLIFCD
jgi:hypothetical protein